MFLFRYIYLFFLFVIFVVAGAPSGDIFNMVMYPSGSSRTIMTGPSNYQNESKAGMSPSTIAMQKVFDQMIDDVIANRATDARILEVTSSNIEQYSGLHGFSGRPTKVGDRIYTLSDNTIVNLDHLIEHPAMDWSLLKLRSGLDTEKVAEHLFKQGTSGRYGPLENEEVDFSVYNKDLELKTIMKNASASELQQKIYADIKSRKSDIEKGLNKINKSTISDHAVSNYNPLGLNSSMSRQDKKTLLEIRLDNINKLLKSNLSTLEFVVMRGYTSDSYLHINLLLRANSFGADQMYRQWNPIDLAKNLLHAAVLSTVVSNPENQIWGQTVYRADAHHELYEHAVSLANQGLHMYNPSFSSAAQFDVEVRILHGNDHPLLSKISGAPVVSLQEFAYVPNSYEVVIPPGTGFEVVRAQSQVSPTHTVYGLGDSSYGGISSQAQFSAARAIEYRAIPNYSTGARFYPGSDESWGLAPNLEITDLLYKQQGPALINGNETSVELQAYDANGTVIEGKIIKRTTTVNPDGKKLVEYYSGDGATRLRAVMIEEKPAASAGEIERITTDLIYNSHGQIEKPPTVAKTIISPNGNTTIREAVVSSLDGHEFHSLRQMVANKIAPKQYTSTSTVSIDELNRAITMEKRPAQRTAVIPEAQTLGGLPKNPFLSKQRTSSSIEEYKHIAAQAKNIEENIKMVKSNANEYNEHYPTEAAINKELSRLNMKIGLWEEAIRRDRSQSITGDILNKLVKRKKVFEAAKAQGGFVVSKDGSDSFVGINETTGEAIKVHIDEGQLETLYIADTKVATRLHDNQVGSTARFNVMLGGVMGETTVQRTPNATVIGLKQGVAILSDSGQIEFKEIGDDVSSAPSTPLKLLTDDELKELGICTLTSP